MKSFLFGLAAGTGLAAASLFKKPQLGKKIRSELTACEQDLKTAKDAIAEMRQAVPRLQAALPPALQAGQQLTYHFNSYQHYLEHKLPQISQAAAKLNSDLDSEPEDEEETD
jgi:gas vesicle protein